MLPFGLSYQTRIHLFLNGSEDRDVRRSFPSLCLVEIRPVRGPGEDLGVGTVHPIRGTTGGTEGGCGKYFLGRGSGTSEFNKVETRECHELGYGKGRNTCTRFVRPVLPN